MRLVYGIVGEGMGHATRSLPLLRHLLGRGHEIRVVVSGRAFDYLVERLGSHPAIRFNRIPGLRLRYRNNRLDIPGSIGVNLLRAASGVRENLEAFRRIRQEGFRPQAVVSDFDSWAVAYARRFSLPLISIDNQHVLARCDLREVFPSRSLRFRMTELVVRMKVPSAYHYLITSFFFPPVRKPRTTLFPPILREAILSAHREPRDHVLVYLRSFPQSKLIPCLKRLPHRFRVYGMDSEGFDGNVHYRVFSEGGFLDDLRTARALVDGGGFSLLSEALNLHVPVLSIPIEGQLEQELNALYLERLQYGASARRLDPEAIEEFLSHPEEAGTRLADYPREDNSLILAALDEILDRASRGEKAPNLLEAPAKGKWGAKPTEIGPNPRPR